MNGVIVDDGSSSDDGNGPNRASTTTSDDFNRGRSGSGSSFHSQDRDIDDDEDDEIVDELDVFLVDNLNLCLLQYPLKPVFGDNNFEMSSVKHRPNHSKLEYEVPYPKNNNSANTNITFVDDDVDDNTEEIQLITASVVPCSNLGVCIIKDGAMHINPIKTAYQMRPSFRNIKAKGEVVEAVIAPVEVKEDKLVVQLKKREGDKPNIMRTLTYTQVLLQEEREPWVNLKFNDINSRESQRDVAQLIAK